MKEKQAKKILKKVIQDYDTIARGFDLTRNHKWEEFDTFLKYIKKGDRVLDLGCGNGRLNKFLEEESKVEYLGIDNSNELLKAAKKNNPKAKFKKGDLLEIPEKDQSSDIIACIAAFHHIPTKKLRNKALEEMRRVLKKDGILIITVWNLFQKKYKKYIWKSRIRSLLSFGKEEARGTLIPWSDSGINRYYYAFKPKELRKLLEQAKFKILEEEKGNNLLFICQKS